MASRKESTNGDLSVKAFPPPSDKELRIKDRWYLFLEISWMIIQYVPQIVLAVFRGIFPQLKSLKGHVALVTGAGRGLGRGLALALAREGCKVAVADVNLATAEDTAEEIRNIGGEAKAFYCNVAKVEDVRKLRVSITRDLGPVDLLVNNAGLVFCKSLEDSSIEEVSGVISVNLLSHFWMVKEFLPSMKARNSGHIVAISSLAAYVGGSDGSAYVASKHGVNGFMECVRDELNRIPGNNIKTTTVCPYFLNTSAEYVEKQWDLRIPARSIEEAVETTLLGIKTDQVIVAIPDYTYYLAILLRLLPQKLFDQVFRVIYAKMTPPAKEEKSPTTVIIEDLANHNKANLTSD